MRPPRRFRQSVFRGARKHARDCCLQIHLVADRNIDRLHMRSRPQHGTDHFRFVDERAQAAFFFSRFEMRAQQPRLSGADGRNAGDHAEMARDPESSRMGDALTVTDDDIGAGFDLFKRSEHDRDFPEGKQPGNIGKGDGEARGPGFEKRKRWIFEDGDRCGRDILLESDIHPRDI